jgi:hypothetical protein
MGAVRRDGPHCFQYLNSKSATPTLERFPAKWIPVRVKKTRQK